MMVKSGLVFFYFEIILAPSELPRKAELAWQVSKEIVKLQRNSSGGLEVIEFDFKDSEHVSHFDKYPDKYQKLCLDFLQDMLSKSKEYT